MNRFSMTRRDFVRIGAGAVAAGAAMKATVLDPSPLAAQIDPGTRPIRFVIVGTGIRGTDLLKAARQVPSCVCVGAADLYTTRHIAAKEAYGADIPVSGDYRTLFDRNDVDAVLIATSDHLHRRVTLDAVAAGKDVYCEKPMSHSVADGQAMVAAVQSGNRIFQAGSQRVSSVLYAKAREIYAAGRIGEVHSIDAQWNRNSPGGAWVYPVPADASPQTVDWARFLQDAPSRPFDPARFFRWRLFADYSSGLGGDLFVHMLSGIFAITGLNSAPTRALSSGGLYHFKDGREFPDLLETIYDYPSPNGALQVHVHCNQNNNDGDERISFFGSTGTLIVNGNSVTFTPQNVTPHFESYGWNGMTNEQRRQGMEEFRAAHGAPTPPAAPEVESFTLPEGYNDTADHLANFFHAINTRQHVVEDEVFGHNAAIGCHMANYSYFHRTVATWDAATGSIKG
ncbi:MAG TPA: Gfo/Idh/MocA family oxidoreductase [Terracidiphilus sp.]|nr:Gfo/Idh/MocA family oxidoreductase [Terracidiphilus sp.]